MDTPPHRQNTASRCGAAAAAEPKTDLRSVATLTPALREEKKQKRDKIRPKQDKTRTKRGRTEGKRKYDKC